MSSLPADEGSSLGGVPAMSPEDAGGSRVGIWVLWENGILFFFSSLALVNSGELCW